MNPNHNSREEELRRREEVLKARELEIRLRELEAEIEKQHEPPVQPTRKHAQKSPKELVWYQRLPNVVKLGVVFVAVIVAVNIAHWLATIVIVGTIAWVSYKLFLESHD
jgi:hypothetical protein